MSEAVCRQLSGLEQSRRRVNLADSSASKQTGTQRNAGIDVKKGSNELLKIFGRSANVSTTTTLLSGRSSKKFYCLCYPFLD